MNVWESQEGLKLVGLATRAFKEAERKKSKYCIQCIWNEVASTITAELEKGAALCDHIHLNDTYTVLIFEIDD